MGEDQSDGELIARVLAGETALFEVIMRRYNQQLFRAARAILRNDADADDAVQQTYIAAYEHLAQFHGDARLSTWLTRITINAAVARSRLTARRGEQPFEAERNDDALVAAAPGATPEQLAIGRELGALLERAVDGLPALYRVVFVLREVQQLSTADTAACLDVTEEVVKVRLHRAKAMLRRTMARTAGVAGAEDLYLFDGPRCDAVVARVLKIVQRARPL